MIEMMIDIAILTLVDHISDLPNHVYCLNIDQWSKHTVYIQANISPYPHDCTS
jgi:hypothetical protein